MTPMEAIPRGDDHQLGAHRGPTTSSAVSRRATWPTSSPFPGIRRTTSPPHSTCGFVMKKRPDLQAVDGFWFRRREWNKPTTSSGCSSRRGYFSLTTVNDAVSDHGRQHRTDRYVAPTGHRARPCQVLTLGASPCSSGPQGVQLALKELERRALVERKQDPQHGRILQAFLTDQGRKVAEGRGQRRDCRKCEGFSACSAAPRQGHAAGKLLGRRHRTGQPATRCTPITSVPSREAPLSGGLVVLRHCDLRFGWRTGITCPPPMYSATLLDAARRRERRS